LQYKGSSDSRASFSKAVPVDTALALKHQDNNVPHIPYKSCVKLKLPSFLNISQMNAVVPPPAAEPSAPESIEWSCGLLFGVV